MRSIGWSGRAIRARRAVAIIAWRRPVGPRSLPTRRHTATARWIAAQATQRICTRQPGSILCSLPRVVEIAAGKSGEPGLARARRGRRGQSLTTADWPQTTEAMGHHRRRQRTPPSMLVLRVPLFAWLFPVRFDKSLLCFSSSSMRVSADLRASRNARFAARS